MQNKPIKVVKKGVATSLYVNPIRIALEGFGTPFNQKLYKDN